jgi:pimeloyl-ACP methyl ester carboxylesterase
MLLIAGIWVGATPTTLILLVSQAGAFVAFVSPVPRYKPARRGALGLLAVSCFIGAVTLHLGDAVVPPRRGEIFDIAHKRTLSIPDIAPEQDIVTIASRFLPLIGGLTFSEASGLLPVISRLYRSMDEERGHYTSPLLSSMIGAPLLFDSKVLTFRTGEGGVQRRGVVFLHGTGGNIGLVCWIISKSGQAIGADTYCPSLGPLGMWDSDRGREILGDLLSVLRERGTTEIYLVGISAGAVGAALLTTAFEKDLTAVALVNGSHPGIHGAKIPLLFLYAQQDERFPPQLLSWIASESARRNPLVTISEVQGDHLYPIKQFEDFTTHLSAWFKKVAR